MAATNRAVQSLNYPTKVVFKSSKPAVVMLYSTLFLGKTYAVQVCLCKPQYLLPTFTPGV